MSTGPRTVECFPYTENSFVLSAFTTGFVRHAYNTFGSCTLWAAYFASLYHGDATRPSTVLMITGPVLIVAVNALWFPVSSSIRSKKVDQITVWVIDLVRAWHRSAILLLDLALFFVLSQPLSRSRGSPMHIPTELAYTPIVVALCFLLPSLVASSPPQRAPAGTSDAHPYSVFTYCVVIISSIAWILFLTAAGPEVDFSTPMDSTYAISIFILITIIYAIPTEDATPGNSSTPFAASPWFWAVLSVLKAGALLITLAVFSTTRYTDVTQEPGSRNVAARTHNYYALRFFAQNDPYVHGTASDWSNNTFGIMFSWTRFVLGMVLRAGYLLSASRVFIDVRSTLLLWMESWRIDMKRHRKDINEVLMAYVVASVLLAVFAISPEVSYTPSPNTGTPLAHSAGVAWAIIALAGIHLVIFLFYMIRNL